MTHATPDSPRSESDWSFIQQHTYDREARRYAVLALGNLAISPASHGPVMQEHSVVALNQCLDSPDDETRFNSAFALNKLASEESNIEYIGASGSIPRLVDLLSTGGIDTIAQATAVLRHLAMRVENRLFMLHANILDPLGPVAESKDKETQREVAALCCQLTLTEPLRLPLVSSTLLVPLTALCSSEDVETARNACGALANLAEAKRTHKRLATTARAMHHMVFIMRSKHLSVHREAARCVANLLSSSAFHRLFLDDGGLNSLFRLCRSLDTETLYNCSLIYRKLSPVLTNHEFIVGNGGLAPLLILTQTLDLSTNRQAVAAMRDISSNLNYKAVMAEEGCLTRAVELARDDDLELRILAVGTLRHLSINTRIKRPIITEGALGPLYAGIEDKAQNSDLMRQCAAVIGNIAENGENQVTLIKDAVLPRLVHMTDFPHPEVLQDVARTYALLASNPENHTGVFGAAEIKSMIKLLASKEENTRR